MSVSEFYALQGDGRIMEWQEIWEEAIVNLSRYCFVTHLEKSRKTSRKRAPRNAVTAPCSLITFYQLNFITDMLLAARGFFFSRCCSHFTKFKLNFEFTALAGVVLNTRQQDFIKFLLVFSEHSTADLFVVCPGFDTV